MCTFASNGPLDWIKLDDFRQVMEVDFSGYICSVRREQSQVAAAQVVCRGSHHQPLLSCRSGRTLKFDERAGWMYGAAVSRHRVAAVESARLQHRPRTTALRIGEVAARLCGVPAGAVVAMTTMLASHV